LQTYARIQNGVIVELFVTDRDIRSLFHPDLQWINVTDATGAQPGWRHDGSGFSPPKNFPDQQSNPD
jgi:hypothetical protein